VNWVKIRHDERMRRVFAVMAVVLGDPVPSPPPTDSSLEQAFSRSQTALDKPTQDFISSNGNLRWATSRALVTEEGAQWWVVRSSDEEWCLVGSLPQGELAASTLLCAPDSEFDANGLQSFVADDAGHRSDIWLIPDGFSPAVPGGEKWKPATPNVLVPS
jgi:hypothetical protein